MRHYNLWLNKYGDRRAQILDSWNGYSTQISELKNRIQPERIIKKYQTKGDEDIGRMTFVDGGEGFSELLGLGVFLIRASGLTVSKSTNDGQCELFTRDLDMNVIDYDEHTKERVELLRDGMEYDIAIRCANEQNPNYLFLDGSLYVKALRKPIRCLEYDLYRKKFVRLLKICKSKGIRLVGISEDSKSRLLLHHLSNEYKVKFPKFMTDSTLLRLIAESGPYRTIEFTPHIKFESDEITADGITANFITAYLQPTELSNPLRIDVPDWENDMGEVISTVAGLCDGSGPYGYPLQLYIAHLDAHISPAQIEWTVKQIVAYLSKKDPKMSSAVLKATRRNSRPN
jgi:hypothetical protein